MHLAVGANQFAGRIALVQGFSEDLGDAISDLEVVFLADREDQLDRVHRRDGRDRSPRAARRHEIANVEFRTSDDALYRRADCTKAAIPLCLRDRGAGWLNGTLRPPI